MEFMDRRGRSLPVQFWLTVESFKNPLESIDSDSSDDNNDQLVIPSAAATLKEDLRMINDLYFANAVAPVGLSIISQKHVDTVRLYASQVELTLSEERKARRSVMLAQRQVEQDMDHDFEDFQRSDLWYLAVSDLGPKSGNQQAANHRPPAIHAPKSNSALSLLGAFVPAFKAEAVRSQSGRKPSFHSDTSVPFVSTLSTSSHPQISYDNDPSLFTPSPVPSRVSSTIATSTNLDILMSSTRDDNDGSTRAPLFDETEDGRLLTADAEEANRMEAIQAAVTDIIASEDGQSDGRPRAHEISSEESLRKVALQGGTKKTGVRTQRKALFDDTLQDLPSPSEEAEEESILFASSELTPPSELLLPEAITRLKEKIDHLQEQDATLDTLIGKAELTGDVQELRLLKKSKSALERELRQMMFQLSQYEQQDAASKLVTGRTRASIVNSTVGEEEGKQVVRYLIEVQRLGPSGSFASGWIVARRYSEFLFLHQQLKEQYTGVKSLDFPGKNLMTSLSSHLLDSRRTALEKYLQVCPITLE